jgi:phage protein D
MSGMLRQPRLNVLANGAAVAGAVSATVISNNYHAADRFYVSVAAATTGNLLDADTIALEVQFSLDGGASFASAISGYVDAVEFEALPGRIGFSGRDLSAALIEARSQETFPNQTASEIATLLAQRHGLSARVTATTTPAGRYWELEHDRLMLNAFTQATAEWDLLVSLAQHEGFDVWVSGSTLYFQPRQDGTPLIIRPEDCVSLRLERALTLAGDVEVIVKSWHSRGGIGCTQSARRQGAGKSVRYIYVVPNLTPDQALTLAQQRLNELTRHERVLVAEMPGDMMLTPRMTLALEGTGTGFDTAYRVDEIERTLSPGSGFVQRVRARVDA